MDSSSGINCSAQTQSKKSSNQNIQVYVRVRPLNSREVIQRSVEVVDVISNREIVTRHFLESKLTKKFTFDRSFGPQSKQVDVYSTVVSPLIEEVLCGYNCTVFAYGQTGTGKTHTMVGTECAELKSSWEDDSDIGMIPRAVSHLFDELRMMEVEFSMRVSYLELYNEELCDLLSCDDSTKIRIFDDSTKKGSVIIQGLEEIPVHSKDHVYKLLEKGAERRKTAATLMNAQSSRSHTVFSILVHIRENGVDGEEMLKIGKLNLVDLAGSENVSKAGNEKGVRVRETVNINQSLLTLGRVITALVERTPHVPYRESKLTRLLQESLGGRTKTSIIATVSPGHKDIDETLSTLEYAHRAKNIQNKPEVNQKLTKKVILKEYTEEIDKLKRDLMAARDKNGIYLAEETYNEMTHKMDAQNRELNEKVLLLKAMKDELQSKERIFNEVSLNLVEKTEVLMQTTNNLKATKGELEQTKQILKTTKKRYEEKKVLINSHVKTEEELTNQATKILEVADMATDDTQKLHTTIERRKEVDLKIQQACNHFAQLMCENFRVMGESLSHLEHSHRTNSHSLIEEFKNAMTLQSNVATHANGKLEHVKELLGESLGTLTSVCETLKDSVSQLSGEQKEMITKMVNELRSKEMETANKINENLNDIIAHNGRLKADIEKNAQRISQCMRRSVNEAEDYTRKLHEQLGHISEQTESSLKDIMLMNTAISAHNELEKEEERLVVEFVKGLDALRQKRFTVMQGIGNEVAGLGAKCTKTKDILQNKSMLVSNFLEQHRNSIDAEDKLARKCTDDIVSCIDQCVERNAVVKAQVDDHCTRKLSVFDELVKKESTYHASVDSSCQKAVQEYKCKSTQGEREVVNELTEVKTGITKDTDDVKCSLRVIDGLKTSLDNAFSEYVIGYQLQMDNCSKHVMNFNKCDLKTYSSTGDTPSKREYKYPRILAATSPHCRIVKRFREENDWSDLDMTVPIDEVSGTEEIIEDSSDCIITASNKLRNSTPIQRSASGSKQESARCELNELSPKSLRPPNALRPLRNIQRTSSPNKPSQHCLPKCTNGRDSRGNDENMLC